MSKTQKDKLVKTCVVCSEILDTPPAIGLHMMLRNASMSVRLVRSFGIGERTKLLELQNVRKVTVVLPAFTVMTY